MFGKISIAHFNPAVTIGFLITKHITKIQLVYYLCAEIIGALLGSVFVKYVIGFNANLGANAPNYSFPIPIVFGIEVLATALLMAVIFIVVYTKGLRGFSGIAIGGIVGLDIFFLAFISSASMNPARSLAPAILSGVLGNLWLYWSATFNANLGANAPNYSFPIPIVFGIDVLATALLMAVIFIVVYTYLDSYIETRVCRNAS